MAILQHGAGIYSYIILVDYSNVYRTVHLDSTKFKTNSLDGIEQNTKRIAKLIDNAFYL